MQLENTEALRKALQAAGQPFVENESLAAHTTFRIGGPAAFWCVPYHAEGVAATLQACRACGVRAYLLGNGSNTLFSDAGFDGAVLSLAGLAGEIEERPGEDGSVVLRAGAGVLLSRLCTGAQQKGLTGLEFAYGIPGTVGGAVYMNAGAYGGEMKDVLDEVTYLDEAGAVCTVPASALSLGYRTSAFETNGGCILSATVCLRRGEKAEILEKMRDFMQRRKDKQPLDSPSAGSTFKRPQGAFAGSLIEQCGLRGYTVGGAQISEKHCGFVINRGGATCADVVALTEEVSRIVREKTGFVLEREIRIVE